MSEKLSPQTKKSGQTIQGKLHKKGEYFEEEIKIEVLPEVGPEEEVGTVVTESENIRRTEVIKVEEEIKTEIKLEVEEVNKTGREVEEESWMKEPNNQTETEKEDDTSSVTTEIFDVNLVNMDLAEFDWEESGNESDTTVKWEPVIETINLKESELTLSDNSHSLEELTQESEDEENLYSPRLKKTYVAMKSAKVEKLVKRKKRKRSKVCQWRVDSYDTEWTPPKKKKAMKIVLVKRRPVSSSESEDEEVPQKSWRRNHHKWLVKKKENMTQNKVLAELKQKADKQKREDQEKS